MRRVRPPAPRRSLFGDSVIVAFLALVSAKLIAAGFGAVLHLTGVHRVVAILTAVYLVAAIVPWATPLLVG